MKSIRNNRLYSAIFEHHGLFYFRHESEKQHAMPIKGRVNKHPAIHISNPPPCPAQVWVQCVDYNYDPNVHINPTPNPNGIFIKTEKERYPPTGVSIIDDGEKDGKMPFLIYNI